MVIRPRLKFNSFFLGAYFILSALIFLILIGIIWSTSIKAQKAANLQHDVNLIMNGITGSILGSAELDSQGLAYQSKSLMQEYLDYTFGYEQLVEKIRSNIVSVDVFILINPYKRLVGSWSSPKKVEQSCLENRTEFFHPKKTSYPYVISISMNTCFETKLNIMEYHTITTPILISIFLLFIWGICIYLMLKSLAYAGKILGKTANVDDLVQKTDLISWTNVSLLTKKAVQVRGRNLQYYQTLILDTQHDIAKILDEINKNYNFKDLNQNIGMVRSILQASALEVSNTSHTYEDITPNREVSKKELLTFFENYFKGAEKRIYLPEEFYLKIKNIFIFERILVNLASNAFKHGTKTPVLICEIRDNKMHFNIHTEITLLSAIIFRLAISTGRIDLKNENIPTYTKLWGRHGRGLSIIKRGILRLGGLMVFKVQGRKIISGFVLKASFKAKNIENNEETSQKRRVIFFDNEILIEECKKYGLDQFFISHDEVIRLASLNEPLEIVSNQDIIFDENYPVKIITKKERIKGLANNWLGIHTMGGTHDE